MTDTEFQNRSSRVKIPGRLYWSLQPSRARILSVVSLGGLHAWLVLKWVLPLEQNWAGLVVSGLALVSFVSTIAMFLTTYSFVAHAPNSDIDERELAQRNEAYLRTHQYLFTMLILGAIALEVAARWSGFQAGVSQYQAFLTVLGFSSLILPGCILAWIDRSDDLS